MAMKYTCDTCKNIFWFSGSHPVKIECHKCGGKMIMPGGTK
jgi:DNA-directed RNA polymerase subunit RPC12/RpoP